MADRADTPNGPHPTDWKDVPEQQKKDLDPHFMEGTNQGILSPHPAKQGLTAYDFKDLQRGQLREMTDEQLKAIPIMPRGSQLRQGATYLDLNDPEHKPFTAKGTMIAGPDTYYVPKDAIDYTLWNRLIGVTNPERLDVGPSGERLPRV